MTYQELQTALQNAGWSGHLEFHDNTCSVTIGPKGGVKISVKQWRTNGRLQTWKRDPNRFRLPVKYGLKSCDALDQSSIHLVHLASTCPITSTDWRSHAPAFITYSELVNRPV